MAPVSASSFERLGAQLRSRAAVPGRKRCSRSRQPRVPPGWAHDPRRPRAASAAFAQSQRARGGAAAANNCLQHAEDPQCGTLPGFGPYPLLRHEGGADDGPRACLLRGSGRPACAVSQMACQPTIKSSLA
eukprot:366466-Chlamydomonas_euryale.AAC.6